MMESNIHYTLLTDDNLFISFGTRLKILSIILLTLSFSIFSLLVFNVFMSYLVLLLGIGIIEIYFMLYICRVDAFDYFNHRITIYIIWMCIFMFVAVADYMYNEVKKGKIITFYTFLITLQSQIIIAFYDKYKCKENDIYIIKKDEEKIQCLFFILLMFSIIIGAEI